MSDWQPIETAPKNQTIILGYYDEETEYSGVGDGYWDEGYEGSCDQPAYTAGWCVPSLNIFNSDKPTRWQPMPVMKAQHGDTPSADGGDSLSTSSLPQIPSIDARVREHQPTNWRKLSDREVVDAMLVDNVVNRVRKLFSHEAARIEQEGLQRRPAGPVDVRRMEFEAADKLIAAALSQGSPGQ